MQISNWIIGLLMLSVMSIKLLWGADLMIVSLFTGRERWWHIFIDGTLFLGSYLLVSGIFVYGSLGFLLLKEPTEGVPLWFAIPAFIFSLDCVLAWHLLQPHEQIETVEEEETCSD